MEEIKKNLDNNLNFKKYKLESNSLENAFEQLYKKKINKNCDIILFIIKKNNKYYIKYFSK